jgi:hypothetical protein
MTKRDEVAMKLVEWSKSSVDYGQKLVSSAIAGANEGEEEFLQNESLAPYLSSSARHAIVPGIVGAYFGVLGGSLGRRRHSTSKTVACGLLGAAIGFGASLIWDSRELTASVASSAWKKVSKTRDEHWFEKNPIDYA